MESEGVFPAFTAGIAWALGLLGAWSRGALTLDGNGPQYEQFYRAWRALPGEEQDRLAALLAPLNDLCTAEARPYLEELASSGWFGGTFVDQMDSWSTADLALRLFVSDPAKFASAHQSYAIDRSEHFREYRGRYRWLGVPTPEMKARMKTAMARHFHSRSSKVVVEDFSNAEKFAVFIYQEDEPRAFERINEQGTIEPDWHQPVIRLAAIFEYETSVLHVKAPRNAQREILRELFAEFAVGDLNYFYDPAEQPRFCFEALRDPRFEFATRPVDHVEDVTIVRIVARPGYYPARRIALDVAAGLRPSGLRDLLALHGVNLAGDTIDGVHLRFLFDGRGRQKYRTVCLLNPNSSNLRDTGRDRVIRRYLREWGFDAESRGTANTMGSAVVAA